jgi:hypothetical protein
MRVALVLSAMALTATVSVAMTTAPPERKLAKMQKHPAAHEKAKKAKAVAHEKRVERADRREAVAHAAAVARARPLMQPIVREHVVTVFRAIDRQRLGVLWVNRKWAVVPWQERRDAAAAAWLALYPAAPVVVAHPTTVAAASAAPVAPPDGGSVAADAVPAAPPAAGPAPSPSATAPDAPTNTCDVTQVEASPLPLATDATAKIFFFGVSSQAVPQPELSAMQSLVEAYLPLPPQTSMMSLQDVNTLLEAEKIKDLVGCDEPDCMSIVGGAVDADYLLNGRVEKLNDKFIFNLRAIDAKSQKVAGAAVFQYSTPRCAQGAIEQASKCLVVAAAP